MSTEIVFSREDGWLPRVLRTDAGLRLEIAGGSDGAREPRVFEIPIERADLSALQADLARHVMLASALGPLCVAAGSTGPIAESDAVALLGPLLRGDAATANAVLARTRHDRSLLVAHGASIELLNRGAVVESLRDATAVPKWSRAHDDEADRRRARQGITLQPLDAALLKLTGQYAFGATIPHRDPDAVDSAQLPAVSRVIETAERERAHHTIRRAGAAEAGSGGLVGWDEMERAVDAALRREHPELGDEAVRTVTFLMCSEAADRARKGETS